SACWEINHRGVTRVDVGAPVLPDPNPGATLEAVPLCQSASELTDRGSVQASLPMRDQFRVFATPECIVKKDREGSACPLLHRRRLRHRCDVGFRATALGRLPSTYVWGLQRAYPRRIELHLSSLGKPVARTAVRR